MTTTSPTNNPESDVEDIFAGSDDFENVPRAQPLQPAPPTESQPFQNTPDTTIPDVSESYETDSNGFNWRPVIIIAIVVGGLLLLSGIVAAGYYWYTQRTIVVEQETATNHTNSDVTPVLNTNSAEIVIPVDIPDTPTATQDSYVDSDHDGLSDEEERVNNTNPLKKDTDEDGLSDREEIRVYLTDPRVQDTDGDGYIDGDEVANFYHPNHPDPNKRLFELPQDN